MRILVVGSTGVLGRHVIPRLIERGHTVVALARRPEQAHQLRQVGAEPVLGDIFDLQSLNAAARGCDAALHIATAIPRSNNQDWSLNDRVRREGTRDLLAAAVDSGVRRYVQQSIIFLYGESGQTIVDESAPSRPSPVIQSAADMEEMVRASNLDWCILRGGAFYGPGTGREDDWRDAARQGRLTLPGDGSDLLSLIHVVDMARAVVAAVESAQPHTIYNVVDDEPVTYRLLYAYIASQLGASEPGAGGPKYLSSIGCSNARIKADLPWHPAYPTYRSGLA
jgi:nucleoside-diphosphate-sugar epimerase